MVLEQLLGDLFGLFLVADDLRAVSSLYCVGSMARTALRVALSGYAKSELCEGAHLGGGGKADYQ